jgi:uncharacterized protein YutD
MEPYFISMDDNCMTVNVRVIPDARYTDSGKEYTKIIGHYSNLSAALKSIAKDKTNSKSYDSLKTYIEEYNSTLDSFSSKISI